jgi:hypothetical protein
MAKRVYARLTQFRPNYNVILSNVPGPDPARYFLGATVSAMYPPAFKDGVEHSVV